MATIDNQIPENGHHKPMAIIFVGIDRTNKKAEYIQAASALGYKTILITAVKNHEFQQLFDAIYVIDILNIQFLNTLIPELKEKYSIKGVMTNHEKFVIHRSFLAEKLSLPATSVYSACCSRNKYMQRKSLDFMNENIPYMVITSKEDIKLAFEKLGGDMCLKSISGIKSHFIHHVTSVSQGEKLWDEFRCQEHALDSDLYNNFQSLHLTFNYPNPKETLLAEKMIYGEEISAQSFVGSHVVWHAPSLCDVVQAKSIGKDDSNLAFRMLPSKQPQDMVQKVHTATETAIRILSLRSVPVYTQLFITPEKEIKIIELASRVGGYRPLMYREAYGIDLAKQSIHAVVHKKFDDKKEYKLMHYVALHEIFAEKAGVLKNIQNYDILKKDTDIAGIHERAALGDKVGKAQDGFFPVLTFLLKGSTYDEVYEKSLYYQKLLEVVVK